MRQLLLMSEGKSQANWAHTSAIIAKIHNANCAKKSDMKNPDVFNPHRTKESDDVVYVDNPQALKKMKEAFVGK